MYDFIKIQYKLGNITKEKVMSFVPMWISKEQANKILSNNHNVI